MKSKEIDFTKGKIVGPLIRFAIPVFMALFLQALYGAVDLLIVGKFADSCEVSAVGTGSHLIHSVTMIVSNFAMGLTIVLGQLVGEGRKKDAGEVMGSGILYFLLIGILLTAILTFFAAPLSRLLEAPEEAFTETVSYVRICGLGFIAIVAYNLLGSVFRGIGDARTPLLAVGIAAIINIFGDLLLVAVFHMGASGAAIATVFSELFSVIFCVIIVRKRGLPFTFEMKMLRLKKAIVLRMTKLGAPLALQELLVSCSFLIILAICNKIGVIESAGVGVAEKVCAFIMLVPSAFAQSMAASTAQNFGAGNYPRAKKTLRYALLISAIAGTGMFLLSFFRGELLTGIFSSDKAAMKAGAEFLKSYGVDCLLTCFMFCMVGFFNGLGMTGYTMLQGTLSAFFIRIPVAFLMSKIFVGNLFMIGLATPCATFVQILMGCFAMSYANRKFGTMKVVRNQK